MLRQHTCMCVFQFLEATCRLCDTGGCLNTNRFVNNITTVDVCDQNRLVCGNSSTGVTFHDETSASFATCFCFIALQRRNFTSIVTLTNFTTPKPSVKYCKTLNQQCDSMDLFEGFAVSFNDSSDFLLMLFDSRNTLENDSKMLGHLLVTGGDIEIQCMQHNTSFTNNDVTPAAQNAQNDDGPIIGAAVGCFTFGIIAGAGVVLLFMLKCRSKTTDVQEKRLQEEPRAERPEFGKTGKKLLVSKKFDFFYYSKYFQMQRQLWRIRIVTASFMNPLKSSDKI